MLVRSWPENDERATGRQGVGGSPHEGGAFFGGEVQVDAEDEVEFARDLPSGDIRLDPGDPFPRSASLFGCDRRALVQCHAREVDGGDLPCVKGEPQCVPAFAAAEIEGPAAGKRPCGGRNNWIGRSSPDEIGGCVAFVPGVRVHGTRT